MDPEGALYVLDGGWLLRKLTWTQNISTYGGLCQDYVHYVYQKFGTRVVVVFDGYEDEVATMLTSEANGPPHDKFKMAE